jgi:predicted PurR-regulated permease PerM
MFEFIFFIVFFGVLILILAVIMNPIMRWMEKMGMVKNIDGTFWGWRWK